MQDSGVHGKGACVMKGAVVGEKATVFMFLNIKYKDTLNFNNL